METNRIGKVEVRSLNKNKFGGLALYPKSSGIVLTPQYAKSGYKTGLSAAEELHFEEALNLPKGTLHKKSDFWHTLDMRVKGKLVLDKSDDWDYIKYKCLINNTKICPSPMELSNFPEAEFVIIDEESIAKQESVSIDWEIKAFEHFVKLSQEDKKGVLKLYGVKADDASLDMINSKLHRALKADPARFVLTVEDKNLKNKIFVEELIENSIITKQKNYYKNGDDIIGTSVVEVLEFITNPKNSNVVANFKARLDKKK